LALLSAGTLGLAGAGLFPSCERDSQAMTPQKIEQQYGVSGAYADQVTTAEGAMQGTIVPVTLADGRKAELIIPSKLANAPHPVFLRDNDGIHPVQINENTSREVVTRSPAVVSRRPEPQHARKRSWEKDALIIGGGAGAGAAIGAVASGKKGAAVGATAGGIGGLIYDLATRDKR